MDPIILLVFYLFIIISLLLGIFYHPLGILLIVADGIFHASAGQNVLEKSSPDHIIFKFLQAGGLFNMIGFGTTIHRIMGISLILLSLYVIYKIYVVNGVDQDNPVVNIYFKIIKPITLIIILLAATVKLYNVVMYNKPMNGSVAMFRIR
jgi:hypothetical protein